MRWKTPPRPDVGDTRRVLRIAWTPVDCNYGNTVWLRPVEYKQEFTDDLRWEFTDFTDEELEEPNKSDKFLVEWKEYILWRLGKVTL